MKHKLMELGRSLYLETGRPVKPRSRLWPLGKLIDVKDDINLEQQAGRMWENVGLWSRFGDFWAGVD